MRTDEGGLDEWTVGRGVAGGLAACGLLAGRPVESGGVGRLGRGVMAITWGEAVGCEIDTGQVGPGGAEQVQVG